MASASSEAAQPLLEEENAKENDSIVSAPLIDFIFSTVPSSRVKLFSDAVWAIIATIMVSIAYVYTYYDSAENDVIHCKLCLFIVKIQL